jgi:RNA polymerase sigma factor (sigma-70 family)
MMAVCMRYAKDKDEAQDILQEGFIKIFKSLGSYRNEGSLEGWVRRIMTYTAINRYRKARTMILVDDFTENTGFEAANPLNGNSARPGGNAQTITTLDTIKLILPIFTKTKLAIMSSRKAHCNNGICFVL